MAQGSGGLESDAFGSTDEVPFTLDELNGLDGE